MITSADASTNGDASSSHSASFPAFGTKRTTKRKNVTDEKPIADESNLRRALSPIQRRIGSGPDSATTLHISSDRQNSARSGLVVSRRGCTSTENSNPLTVDSMIKLATAIVAFSNESNSSP